MNVTYQKQIEEQDQELDEIGKSVSRLDVGLKPNIQA